MRTLKTLTIEGFKSIRKQTLALGNLNVFIGGNGSGKSNLIQAFRLLREIGNQSLEAYTAVKGGADSLLHFGRKRSSEIFLRVNLEEDQVPSSYEVHLAGTDNDELIILRESNAQTPDKSVPLKLYLSSGVQASKESTLTQDESPFAVQILRDLDNCRIYHFHDTSDTAAMKGTAQVEDNRLLRSQAENLAAFLYWMQEKKPDHFRNVQDTIRQIAPFFEKFRLAPRALNESTIRLEWKEKGSEAYFNASSLSDGTLRFICLATLLLQPELPTVILLDEPELGLHPAAITLLAGLLQSAATRTQIIVATQSVTLVNQFAPEDVWTVDREDSESVFRHLKGSDMTEWLDEYSLGDLWEKGVLGARP